MAILTLPIALAACAGGLPGFGDDGKSMSYTADRNGTKIVIDRDYVEGNLGELSRDQDLSRYIL